MLRRIALACLLAVAANTAAFAAAGFIKAGPMASPRVSAGAVTLPDGSVLVASGDSVERFDPATRTFSLAGALTTNRGSGLTATLLGTGRVLIVGGQAFDASQESAELFDPETGSSAPTGSMSTPRSFHAATQLADGRVLITGGHRFNAVNSALDTAEIYNPTTEEFTLLSETMETTREGHTATLLEDGRVLVVGGLVDIQLPPTRAELFDPVAESFTPIGTLVEGRASHTASRLPNGQVVVAGGYVGYAGSPTASVEIYDPATSTFLPGPTLMVARSGHTATSLSNGTLLIAGGFSDLPYWGAPVAVAELFDPIMGSAPTASMHEARGGHVAAPLLTGEVLIAGGRGPCCGFGLTTAEVFSASVVDRTAPVVTVPFDITVAQETPQGVVVDFTWLYPSPPSAVDDVDTAPSLSCEPASGSTFPVGVNSVECTATDFSGNRGSASFRVTVLETLNVTMTIDAKGKVDPRTGLATVTGRVGCNRAAQGFIFVELSQGRGPSGVLGSNSRGFRCVPPSFAWSLHFSVDGARFYPGTAQARASGNFSYYGQSAPSVERSVKLEPGTAGAGAFPITKIVESGRRMPGSPSRFGSLGLPFVRDGKVVFQGFGPTLSETGLYFGSRDGRLDVIADTRTAIPGATGVFTSLDSPTFDGATVVFQGFDAANRAGLYRARDGSLIKVADVGTSVPGGAGAFNSFVGPVVSGDRIAFRGSSDYSEYGSFGVYAARRGVLSTIADQLTAVPDGPGNFQLFGTRPILDGESVVFPARAAGFSHSGIYVSRNGVLRTVADTNTTMPGGSAAFFGFGPPASQGGVLAFRGLDPSFKYGLYRSDAGTLRKVADSQTPVPGRSATFGFFGDPVVEDGVVAFSAVTSAFEPAGLYTHQASGLSVIADVYTPAPGGQGNFSGFGERLVLSSRRVAFMGSDAVGTPGIYVRVNGKLHKIISDTDTLDGKAIAFLQLAGGEGCSFGFCNAGSGTGFDGGHVAFHVTFTGTGGYGIYLATLPAKP